MSNETVNPQPRTVRQRLSATTYYFTILRRRKVAAIVAFAIPVLAAVAYSAQEEVAYQGTAQVVLSRQNLANALTNTPDPAGQANDFIRIVQTQADIARSPAVARRAITIANADMTPQQLLASSTVNPSRDADILTFHVEQHLSADAVRLTNAYAKAFTEYRVALDTMSLRKAQTEVSQRLQQLREQGNEDSTLTRSLISKEQELATLEALQTSNSTLVSSSTVAEQVSPHLRRNVFLGIIAGLVLMVVVLAILEVLDNRVRDEGEAEEILGLSPLARIGPPPRDVSHGLLMMNQPNAPENEAFRLLRTNLQFAAVSTGVTSILVTSSIQGEGKSTTIANLAIVAARSGERVALVDLDLRRPTLRGLFQLPPAQGLTDVLLGRIALDDALEDIPIYGAAQNGRASLETAGSLTLLGAGTIPPNPGELIASDAIGQILKQVKDRADLVFIDAPPALVLGDALILSALADAAFVCVRIPLVTRPMLDHLRRALESARVQTLGCVITGDLRQSVGGYGYGYGYGYGATEESAPPTVPAPTPGASNPLR